MLDTLFLGVLTALVLIVVVFLAIIISPFGSSDNEDVDEEFPIDTDKTAGKTIDKDNYDD